jgi:hypothetical protein
MPDRPVVPATVRAPIRPGIRPTMLLTTAAVAVLAGPAAPAAAHVPAQLPAPLPPVTGPAVLRAPTATSPGALYRVSGSCPVGTRPGAVESEIFAPADDTGLPEELGDLDTAARLRPHGPGRRAFTRLARVRSDAAPGRHRVDLSCVGPEGAHVVGARRTVTVGKG